MRQKPPIGRSIGSLMPKVTQKALEKYGFPAAALLTDWPAIAGPELAAYTSPERLRWPHRPEAEEASTEGATLVLRAEGPRALELQHGIAQLKERINTHFGFLAVTDIRILQAPVANRPQPRPARPQAQRASIPAVEIPDDRLRDALERLQGSVTARNKG
jgi:hypothetical protein